MYVHVILILKLMIALLEVNERHAFLMGIEMGNSVSKLASNAGFLQAEGYFF